jgi:hypothetical protein
MCRSGGRGSVLQLACKEARGKGGQAWYDGQVTGNNILEFFRDRRNLNVHTIPVSPIKEFQLHIEEFLYVTIDAVTTVTTWVSDENTPDAENVREGHTGPATPQKTESGTTMTETYKFSEWSGLEDIKTLCKQYLGELRKIVADGKKSGFLT